MTRARSHAEHEAAAEAVRDLVRTRSAKESKAWELVNRHDNELGHVNRRLTALELNTVEIRSDIAEIKESQRDTEATAHDAKTHIEKIEKAQEKQQVSQEEMAKYKRSLRNDLFRNLVSLASLIVAVSAMAFRNC